MAAAGPPRALSLFQRRLLRLMAQPRFQSWVARMPLLRRIARRDGGEMFQTVQGFVSSQVLAALIEADIFARLEAGPKGAEALARETGTDPARLAVFLQAGAALGLLQRMQDGGFALARQGAALLGVPGLSEMILHHKLLYQDLAAPGEMLRDGPPGALARFWPYVQGGGTGDAEETARYSALMAGSQALVAEDVLRMASFRGVRHLMDVGGGSGAFLAQVAQRYPRLALSLFDLPQTQASARAYLAAQPGGGRIRLLAGDFQAGRLPQGADAVSLIRVLHDHTDATVADLLAKVFTALPPGGRLIVAEPMSGGARPDPVTDVYFAIYTLAMGTGRLRAPQEIAALLRAAGFHRIRVPRPKRSYVASAVTAVKPG